MKLLLQGDDGQTVEADPASLGKELQTIDAEIAKLKAKHKMLRQALRLVSRTNGVKKPKGAKGVMIAEAMLLLAKEGPMITMAVAEKLGQTGGVVKMALERKQRAAELSLTQQGWRVTEVGKKKLDEYRQVLADAAPKPPNAAANG